MSSNGTRVKRVSELVKRVRKNSPQNVSLVKDTIFSFSPRLLINRVTPDYDVKYVVRRIQKVTREMLSINVEHMATLPYQAEIEYSVRELVPVVAKYPRGEVAGIIRGIVNNIL